MWIEKMLAVNGQKKQIRISGKDKGNEGSLYEIHKTLQKITS